MMKSSSQQMGRRWIQLGGRFVPRYRGARPAELNKSESSVNTVIPHELFHEPWPPTDNIFPFPHSFLSCLDFPHNFTPTFSLFPHLRLLSYIPTSPSPHTNKQTRFNTRPLSALFLMDDQVCVAV